MANTMFELYRSQVMALAKTMVVKLDAVGEVINRRLEEIGYAVNSDDRYTWKYYLNLSGEYHESDTPMKIVSLDNPSLGEQTFTKDLLSNNKLTREHYRYGTRYYRELIRKYPEQELLIHGIIYPTEIDTLVNAEDGDIVFYEKTLVESNETNLISDLEIHIKNFLKRWHNKDYTFLDDLYLAAMLSILYLSIPQKIINIRLANCKTERAHSHHIRQYLESNGKLAKYIKFLTKKQMLFLYRNIRYILRNAGKQQTFDMLVDNILTERGLPLAGYEIRHMLSHADDILQRDDYPNNVFPDVYMKRRAINFTHVGSGSDERSLEYILDKQRALVEMDDEEVARELLAATEAMAQGIDNAIPTKVMESVVVDTTDSVAYPLSEVLLNHWIYFAATGKYIAAIDIVHPVTGEPIILNVKDALVLYSYALLKSTINAEEEPVYIGEFLARKVRREVKPTVSEIYMSVDPLYVPLELVQAATDVPYEPGTYLSNDDFYDACVAIQEGMMAHREMYTTQNHHITRGQAYWMTSLFYEDVVVYPEGDAENLVSYATWLTGKGLELSDLSREQYIALADQIVSKATGAGSSNSKSLRQMHEAMISLMQDLSSYSVQYLRTINSSNETVLEWPLIRLGDFKVDATTSEKYKMPYASVINDESHHHSAFSIPMMGDKHRLVTGLSVMDNVRVNLNSHVKLDGGGQGVIKIPMPMVSVKPDNIYSIDLTEFVYDIETNEYRYPDS